MAPTTSTSQNYLKDDVSKKLEKMRSLLHADEFIDDPWFLDDKYLVWWLEERNMNVRKAVKKFRQTMIWRKEKQVENISYDENWINTIVQCVGINHEGGPIFMNRPVPEVRVGEGMLEQPKEEMEQLLIFQMETMITKFKEIGNYKPATVVVDGNQCWMVGDMRGMGMQAILQYPQLKATAQLMSMAYEMYKARYPGMIGDFYLINCPSLIRKAFEYVSKPYIRADILAKVKTYGPKREKWRKDLSKVMKEDEIDYWLPPGAKPRY